MKINKGIRPFLRNIYSYDISHCHYEIMVRNGIDVSHIEKDDKTKRNIQIGLMMKENSRLTDLLRTVTNSTIDEYILQSKLRESEIVLRQYDGLYTTKKMNIESRGKIPLELRDLYTVFISSLNREMFIAIDDFNKTKMKGIPNKYQGIENYLEKILKINYLSKTAIFKSLEKIKNSFFSDEDVLVFAIPEDDKFKIHILEYGELIVSEPTLDIIDIDEIDKQKYYDIYLRPFTETICMEFM